ncbi:sugar phosphate isomerase/epimerase family protein [Listeria costaricensis]|uniref:sugar phosphate isomerase/epimerase family protein n=1 Tax=Listeria costaricensis TaxID=2026604 RepID=UPI000C06C5A7|nr:sugar phosphate isomerase/epimerase family protein [Listeria costaricensis]
MGKIKTCVSLYSLQDEYLNGRMTLEDIFQFLHENDVEGIEILPDQMIPGAPEPTEEMLREWDALVEKYGMALACDDVFLNTNLYNNRELTLRESIDLITKEIELAHRLGFSVIRLVSMVPIEVIEPVLPLAEKYQIKLCIEIHAGLGFGIDKTEEFLEVVKRLDSPYLGAVVDMGLFCRRVPRVFTNYFRAVNPPSEEVIEYVDQLFEAGGDYFRLTNQPTAEFKATQKELIKSEADAVYLELSSGYENLPLSVMDPYIKYIHHFHFKLYEMTDEGEEYSIDYRGVLEYLHEKGYDGYVSTEYEGNRWILPGKPMIEKEQVLAHQKMIKSLLKEIQG